jgi:ribonuclease P protein component
MSNSLPKKIRLCDNLLIEALFQKGEKLQSGYLICKYLESKNFQVGFSAPKKLFPRAVDRNQIKRHLRESFRLHYKEILGENPKGYGYFIFKGRINTSFKETEKVMIGVLNSWRASLS